MAKRTVGFRFSQQTLDRLERVAAAWAVTRTHAFEQMVDEAWAKLSYRPIEGEKAAPVVTPETAVQKEKFPVRDAYANLHDAMAGKVKDRPVGRGRKKGGS